MKVLIVDDSPDAIRLASARLSKENVEVISSNGGPEALKAVRAHEPDLVLLDVDMPEVSGFEVCRRLKEDPELLHIPVIFLTAVDAPAEKVRGLDLGAVDYVTKPFDAFELRARVRAALRTKHYQDLLTERAHIDPLTGLPNRGALDDRLEQAWARAMRRGGDLSVLMMDVDHFKKVNDDHGHAVGDEVLQQIAHTLRAQCRTNDLPARYGGEEFAVIVPEEHASAARKLAERVRGEVGELRIESRTGVIRPAVSVGVADSSAAATQEDLIELSDAALYKAKQTGRNRVVLAPSAAEGESTDLSPVR